MPRRSVRPARACPANPSSPASERHVGSAQPVGRAGGGTGEVGGTQSGRCHAEAFGQRVHVRRIRRDQRTIEPWTARSQADGPLEQTDPAHHVHVLARNAARAATHRYHRRQRPPLQHLGFPLDRSSAAQCAHAHPSGQAPSLLRPAAAGRFVLHRPSAAVSIPRTVPAAPARETKAWETRMVAVKATARHDDRANEDRANEDVSACDLCGAADPVEVAAATAENCRTLLCRRCGLMYASPRFSAAVLSGFYDDEFAGDAGAFARSGDRGVAAAKVGKEERTAKERSEEHTSELQSLMRISYAVFCLKKNKKDNLK